MSKKLLLSIILTLIILNMVTLFLWQKSENIVLEGVEETISNTDIVATIGKENITYDEWIEALRTNYGKKELEEMIDQSVVRQLAKENDMEIDAKVIERELANVMATQGILTQEEIKAAEKKWRSKIIYRYERRALLTKDSQISEEEMQAYYEEYEEQYNFSESVQVSHLVVDNMDIAEKVMDELDQGASFPLLTMEYSNDDDTKQDGGYMGYMNVESIHLPSSYKDELAHMEEDTYSAPINLGDEVAIIYLHRHLPEITFTYEEIEPYLKSELALKESERTLHASDLWDEYEIDWIYN